MTMGCRLCQVSETSEQKPDPLLKITDFETYKKNGQLHFPTELDLINLICVEKKLNYGDKCIHDKTAKEIEDYLDARGWKLLEVLAKNKKKQHAAAFWNTKKSQLVIIHRGTKLTHLNSLKADLDEIVAQEIGAFGFRAYDFTSRMIDTYRAGVFGSCSSITVAGHSLGGFLAQLATFLSKYPEKLGDLERESGRKFWDTLDYERYNQLVGSNSTSRHLHCVSFDGTGLKGVITKLFPKYPVDSEYIYKLLDSLDIEVYLCNNVNGVNAVNEQLGSIFIMQSDSIFVPDRFLANWNPLSWYDRMFGSHSSDKILEFWRGYCKGEGGCQVRKVNDWKVCEGKLEFISNAFSNSKEIPDFPVRNPLEFRASCFDDMERATIRNLHGWKAHYKKNQGSWDETECVKFITDRLVCSHNYQVLKIILDPKEEQKPLYLYRDYFIAKMKYEINEVRKLVRNTQLPDYAANVFIYITQDYLRTLPQFETSDETVPRLNDFLSKLNASVKLDRFVIITSEQQETRICTAKVFEILKSFGLWIDPKSYLVLNTDILRELEDLYSAEFKDLNYIVIECNSHFDAGVIDKWVDKFKGNASIIVIASNELTLSKPVSGSMVFEASDLKALYKTLKFESLNESIQFKIKGNRIRVSDLIPFKEDFWKYIDKYELCKMMRVGWIGAELPQLTSFEESYFIERTIKGGEGNCMELLLDTNQQQRLVIIADESGTGKTIIMKKLAIYKQTTKSEQVPWTIFVDLNLKHIQEIINNCNRESYIDTLAKFETESRTNSLIEFLGEIRLHPNRLYVFLDGLDEMNENLRFKTLNLVDVLIKKTKACVFIATRTWLANELKNRFKELKPAFYELNKFTEKECVLFLCNYWTNHKDFIAVYKNEVINRNFVIKYAKALLTKFRKVIGKEADKFIGIPFQLQMLASAFLHKPFMEFYEKYKQNTANVSSEEIEKWLPKFKNVTQLYTKFVRAKIKEALLAKCGINVDPETSRAALAACDPQERWLEIHRMAGFDHIFGYEHRKPFASEKIVEEGQIDILHCTGIVKDHEKGEYIHRSMSEYLAAEFIVHMVRTTGARPELVRFLDLNLFLEQYQNVAHFVNWLSINTTLSRPLSKMFAKITDLDTNMEAIVDYLQTGAQDTDCLGRNIMHYLFLFDSLHSRAESCLKCGKDTNHTFLTTGQHLLDKRDLFQATPLAYGHLSRDYVKVKPKSLCGEPIRCEVIRKLLFPDRDFYETRDRATSLKAALSQTCPGTCSQSLGVHSSALVKSVKSMIQNFEPYTVDYSILCRKNHPLYQIHNRMMGHSDTSMLERILDSILSVGGGRSSNNVARIGFAARLIVSLSDSELKKRAIQFLYAIVKENDYEYYKSCIRYEIKVEDDVKILECVPESDYAKIFGVLRDSGFVNLKKALKTRVPFFLIATDATKYVRQFRYIMQYCGHDSISAEDKQEIAEIIVECGLYWHDMGLTPDSMVCQQVRKILDYLVNVVGAEKFCENSQGFELYEVIKEIVDNIHA